MRLKEEINEKDNCIVQYEEILNEMNNSNNTDNVKTLVYNLSDSTRDLSSLKKDEEIEELQNKNQSLKTELDTIKLEYQNNLENLKMLKDNEIHRTVDNYNKKILEIESKHAIDMNKLHSINEKIIIDNDIEKKELIKKYNDKFNKQIKELTNEKIKLEKEIEKLKNNNTTKDTKTIESEDIKKYEIILNEKNKEIEILQEKNICLKNQIINNNKRKESFSIDIPNIQFYSVPVFYFYLEFTVF